jgi:predicted site-specific integrase-resolvase
MTGSDVKTAAEAAERLGVTHMTIQRWAKDGTLTAIRKAPLLFDAAEVERRAAVMAEAARAKAAHLAAEAAS